MGVVSADLRKLFEPTVQALGFELVHVEWAGTEHRSILRVYLDSLAGVVVDDCARVSEQLSAVLDVEGLVDGPYALEVSSPGLDRPLVKPADFERFSGETIRIHMRESLAGRKNFKGRLIGIRDGQVIVDMDEQMVELAFDSIEKARLVPKL